MISLLSSSFQSFISYNCPTTGTHISFCPQNYTFFFTPPTLPTQYLQFFRSFHSHTPSPFTAIHHHPTSPFTLISTLHYTLPCIPTHPHPPQPFTLALTPKNARPALHLSRTLRNNNRAPCTINDAHGAHYSTRNPHMKSPPPHISTHAHKAQPSTPTPTRLHAV